MKLHVFLEDLIWCPSQIYFYFISNNIKFCIYLRWRHRDPWTAELVKCTDNWDFSKDSANDWKKIKLSKDYKSEEYKELEEEVLEKIKTLFPTIDFSDSETMETTVDLSEALEDLLKLL